MDSGEANRAVPVRHLTLGSGVLRPADRAELDEVWNSPEPVAVRCDVAPVPNAVVLALLTALDSPLAASSSPIAVEEGPPAPVAVTRNPALSEAPTIDAPDSRWTVLSWRARQLVPLRHDDPASRWSDLLRRWSHDANAFGLRHVAAPGTAVQLDSRTTTAPAAPADNSLLEAHRLWTSTQLRPLRLLLDGRCMSAEPATGTHLVILELAKHLKHVRPGAEVTLAVPRAALRGLRRSLEPAGVHVTLHKGSRLSHDVVYRPYQMLDPAELPWLRSVAHRWLVSQLDMIGFSIREYHPDVTMSDTVRNLQRALLRHADGVTFISEFGRRTAFAECPELEPERCVAIPIGAPPTLDPAQQHGPALIEHPYVLCLAADFRHKNRVHALRVFRALRSKGYRGGLVLAGHHLRYGSSRDEEHAIVASWPEDERAMVRWLGSVDETSKWLLLRDADSVLYPSVVEGFGLVPFEAASVGTPCLAARGSAFEELTADTDVVLANSWDPEEWACIIQRWHDDPVRRDDQVSAVREAANRYTWDTCAARTWELIDRVIASPRRSAPTIGRQDGASASSIEFLKLELTARGQLTRSARRLVRAASTRTADARRRLVRYR